jgi:hypothetical protein
MKTIKTILERLRLLIIKLISIKGTVFILATVLKFMGIINDWIWFAFGTAVISIRAFEKLIGKMPDNGNKHG